MNLLHDKREQERNQQSGFSEIESESLFNEDKARQESPSRPAKKRSGISIVATLLVLAIAVFIIYFGFYKPKQAPIGETGIVSDEVPSETTLEQKPPQQEQGQASAQQSATTTQSSSIAMAATILQRIQESLQAGDVIGTMVFDEGSFSAEITSSSVDNAMSVYDRLVQALPSGVTVTSTQPTAGQNVLVSGTYSVAQVPPAQVDDLESIVNTIAEQHAVDISSFTMNAQAEGRSFIFLKLNAGLANCQQFLQTLSQQVAGIQVSKLILMPSGNEDFTCVLRFFI